MGSAKAGKAAGAAGAAAAGQLRAAGQQGMEIVSDAAKDALKVVDPYRLKLDNVPKLIADNIHGNIDQLPEVGVLSRRVNNLNQSEINRLLGKVLPGYKTMVDLASNNTLSMLRGELPADVAALIRRTSAGRALIGGFSGSEAASAGTARDLGVTSLNLTTEGSNAAQRWISTARSQLMPALFDPTSMLASPQFTLSSILGAAGIAKDESQIITGTASKKADILLASEGAAVNAQLQGAAGQIAGEKGASDAIAKGIQGVTGAIGGMYMPGGGTGTGGTTIPNSVYSNWTTGPQGNGTYYVPKSYTGTGGSAGYAPLLGSGL